MASLRATAILNSIRGRYIIGQALDVAIETLKKEGRPQESNIADMELLRDEFFPIAYAARMAQEEYEKRGAIQDGKS